MNYFTSFVLALFVQFTIPTSTGANAVAPPSGSCGASVASVLADYWAGSLTSTPVTGWNDSSANANNLTAAANPTWANNTFGTGLPGVNFTATTAQYAATSSVIPSTIHAPIAVYAVVKMGAGATGSLTSNHSTNSALALQINASHKIELDHQATALICQSTGTVSGSTNTEFAVLYDGATCSIYINGTLDSTTPFAYTTYGGIDTIGNSSRTAASMAGSIYEMVFVGSTTYDSTLHSCWASRGLP